MVLKLFLAGACLVALASAAGTTAEVLVADGSIRVQVMIFVDFNTNIPATENNLLAATKKGALADPAPRRAERPQGLLR